MVIGGGEDKTGHQEVLAEVARLVGAGPLVIATLASSEAERQWPEYKKVFRKLGVKELRHLAVSDRSDAVGRAAMETVANAKGVFFTGGDQLKITSDLGGTKLCELIRNVYEQGGVIAGTSAGASVMSSTMITAGPSDSSVKAKGDIKMAPGLDFLEDIIVDQHFAQRGRISRLLGAIALNPRFLGIGIDENTAIVLEKPTKFRVIGAGSVYVLDAQDVPKVNVSDDGKSGDANLSIYGVQLYVMNRGECFDLTARRPIAEPGQKVSGKRAA